MSEIVELWRKPRVLEVTGKKRAKLQNDIKAGTFPPPIKDGRSSCWASTEVGIVNAARIAGRSDAEIKELVAGLVKQRHQAMSVAT